MAELDSGRLVFIIGAGASAEFGLPTGNELKGKIRDAVRTEIGGIRSAAILNPEIHRSIHQLSSEGDHGTLEEFYGAAELIYGGLSLSMSIDNFIETHSANSAVVKLGKVAIVHCILAAENSSELAVDDSNIYNKLAIEKLANTWIAQLFSVLSSGKKFEDFVEQLRRITFISFNYDRCIQQYFWHATKAYFSIPSNVASQVVDNLNIIYPYGTISPFMPRDGNLTNFGIKVPGYQLPEMAKNIRTFTEGCNPDVERRLSQVFEGAERVYFLGFGFLPLNMEMLFRNHRYQVGSVVGTSFGMPNAATTDILRQLASVFVARRYPEGAVRELGSDQLVILNKACRELVWEYHRDFLRRQ